MNEIEQGRLPILEQTLFNRVKKNLKRLKPWAKREKVSCYRIYDRDVPEIPLAVDLYEHALHVAVYSNSNTVDVTNNPRKLLTTVAQYLSIPQSRVFIKIRERQKDGSQYEKVSGESSEFVISEGGYKFKVNLSDYLDTGLFLDHRRARKLVGQESQGKHVLNLFAYTGSFSVYAAGGGALSTTTVDLSNTYLGWARENLRLNGFGGTSNEIVRADVISFLNTHRPAFGGYDLAVVDAPTISRSKRMDEMFDIQKDHVQLLRKTLERIRSGGICYFATNFRKFRPAFEGIDGVVIKEISEQTVPYDFRDKNIHSCFKLSKG